MSTQCITPLTLSNAKHVRDTYNIGVPCGKCPNCLSRRVSGWSIRLINEGKRSISSSFVTLTYGNDTVPITPKNYMSLRKEDLQLFFKRLRKVSSQKIKYYAVGEYGSKTLRPHYHLIIFNAEHQHIYSSWGLGDVHFGEVTGASIGYTLKYISKPAKVPLHRNDDRLPEFSLMSKHLGDNYATPQMVEWHNADNERMFIPIEDGKKAPMPRYYKNLIYSEYKRKVVGHHSRVGMLQRQAMERQLDDLQLLEAHKAQFRKLQKDAQNRQKL